MPEFHPKWNRVVVRPVGEVVDRTDGGLWIPEIVQDRQRYRQWEVVACGPDADPAILPGMRLIADSRFAGQTHLIDGTEYRFVPDERFIAIVLED